MKLPPLKNHKWNYLALSFAFPCVGMLVLMVIAGYNPFGDRSMLYSDMWHQYYPFFNNFREALTSGDSLLYNWSIGMGVDYLGLVSYYLASPLNLLCVLVPQSWTLPLFGLLMPIKLGFAGLFFAVFLKKMFHRDDLSLPLFGSFYALCAWALGYQWNIMWLDTFALLPLVALGTVALLRDRKFVLYTVTLFLSVFTNYYIGFFTCIFVLLLFICYQICRCKSPLRLLADFTSIGIFTVIALGMTAVLSLPALAALQDTYSSVNSFPEYFSLNIVEYESCKEAREAWEIYKTAKEAGQSGLWDLWWTAAKASYAPVMEGMAQVAGNMNGGLKPTFIDGLPNLYCGVGTILLAFLFLTAKQVKLRDKLCCVFLLAFFAFSFVVRQLDYIWHGFHFTNQIPYRFSFLYSFVMLYMAYRAFLLRHSLRVWQIAVAGLLSIGVMMLSKDSLADGVYLAYNIIFFLLYFGLLIFLRLGNRLPREREERLEFFRDRKLRRRIVNIGLAAVMGLELILNLVNFGVAFPYTGISDYPRGTKYTASVIRYMQEDDDLFYRAEVTHSQTLNDSALNGYNGISTFTSSANVKVTEFLDKLGYAARNNYNRYCYEEGSPVANLFLNLKYMIEREGNVEENPYFDVKGVPYGGVYLLENNAYLPLGFLTEKELGEMEFLNSGNQFSFENYLFRSATGITENVWMTLPANSLTVNPNNTEVLTQSGGYTNYRNGSTATVMNYTYEISQEGFLCLDMNMSAKNSFTVYLNGKELYRETLGSLPQTLAVSQVRPGDTVMLEIRCSANQEGTVNIRPAILDEALFRRGYEILAASTLELTAFSNTRVEGTIHCNRDGLLYTSIPQDGNWYATVDGQPVELTYVGSYHKTDSETGEKILVEGPMIALELTEGEHTVVFTYRNEAFALGWKVSLACLAVFLAITATVYRKPLKAALEKLVEAVKSRL